MSKEDNLCVVGSYLVGFHGLSSLFPLLLTRFPFVDVVLLVWFPQFLFPLGGFRGILIYLAEQEVRSV